MAAALTILAKQRGDVTFVHQSMYYPVTDAAQDTDSYREFADGPYLTAKAMAWFWDAYLPDCEQRGEITASPLRASLDDLAGLPEAFLIVDENDVLRDEGEAYARKLTQAGVRTTSVRYNGTLHDFMMLNPVRETAATTGAIEQAIHVLRKALAPDRPEPLTSTSGKPSPPRKQTTMSAQQPPSSWSTAPSPSPPAGTPSSSSCKPTSLDAVAVANPLRSLAGDAAYVRDVIAAIGGPVVLVGHSYGGMVITEAAAGNDAVVGLVYVVRVRPRARASRRSSSRRCSPAAPSATPRRLPGRRPAATSSPSARTSSTTSSPPTCRPPRPH